ncbi:MAG: hypothetical protein FJ264_00070 [Planctomycetes bacterium]|nr:hypothetical protein [Planctomycetota bacterium]
MSKTHSITPKIKQFFFCFVMLIPLFKVLYCNSAFAEGQTKFSQDFFNTAEPITLKDPLAVLLGAMDNEGVFVFTYADAVKFAGHSCPAVAGAYKSTQLALKKLYGNETPVRGNIHVTVMGSIDSNVNGPVSQIVTMITGAAADSGFKGFGPAGKYGRYNLMSFAPEQKTVPQTTCTLLFQRQDTGKKVEITYNAAIAHSDERMEKLMPLALSGKATEEQAKLFGNLMQERVKIILLQPPEGTFAIREPQ